MPLQITLVQQFEQHRDETWALAFSQDGKQLVSSDGKALYLWRLSEEGIWEYEHSLPFRNATFPQFAPHGTTLAFGGKEEFVKLISVDGREIATFPSPSHASWAFSPDQRWLVSSANQPDPLLWDLATYQSSSISTPNGSGGPFLFTPDGQRLVFGDSSPEGYMHIGSFDPEHRRFFQIKTFATHGMLDGAISPDGKMLAMVAPNGQVFAYKEDIYIYDLESLLLLRMFPQTSDDRYNLLAFSPDSQYLMSCKVNGWIDIFSLSSFDRVAQFAAHPGLSSHVTDPIGGLAWSKTGYIATGGASWLENDASMDDHSVKIWKVKNIQ